MNSFARSTRRTLVLVALAAVASVSPALHAQSGPNPSRIGVPFAFDYGSRHFAPGVYTLDASNEHVLIVRGSAGAGSAIATIEPEINLHPSEKSKVVFRRANDRYILQEFWMQGSTTHIEAILSRAERRAERDSERAAASRSTSNQAANSTSTPYRIELALLDQSGAGATPSSRR